MNIRPTLWKILLSVVTGMIFFIYETGYLKCDSPNGCPQAIYDSLIHGLAIAVIVFTILSLASLVFLKIKSGK